MRLSSTFAFITLVLATTSMALPRHGKGTGGTVMGVGPWPSPPAGPPPPPPPPPGPSNPKRIGRRAIKGQPRAGPRKVNMAGAPALDPEDIHDIVMAPWPSPPPQPPSRSGRKRIRRTAIEVV
ncbi:uncharacterized protein LACBIDRAFT_314244 [Laccaria bicolor S238N-H82]|uniref:Predicted protein n=1 Tax=Laccaria bicolor (strain S238N-H82 / ATCC MYA-4686) TaxID=486041 RepID=B0D1W6_LACBS|nr:uncharacterized protein LACBIDRAFT_314244 [Laccaria bicolor S238N-H82]EDR11714.1 predicted protein [Laccaria bicolor S238N-H82]|eukprot:XP_001877611.1 predicted protein [Laccaria bicolor S238N-H82]